MLKTQLKDQSGFSLVELIVVIAIMIILIAMLVPNVIGYVNKATIASEKGAAQTIYSSAQAWVSDAYGQGTKDVTGEQALSGAVEDSMIDQAQVDKYSPTVEVANGSVTKVSFESATGKGTIVYQNGAASLES